MPAVDIIVNGTFYQVSCGAGQEKHLTSLASDFDAKVREFSSRIPLNVGDKLPLIMAALTFIDEARDAKAELKQLREKLDGLRDTFEQERKKSLETELLPIIDSLTERVDTIIEKFSEK